MAWHRFMPTSLLVSADSIQTTNDIIRFIAGQPSMVNIPRVVEALNLPDCWTGAGFVRNVVWDALHDRPWSSSYSDIDVVYFDTDNLGPDQDIRIETKLTASIPDVPWSVRTKPECTVGMVIRPMPMQRTALRH